LSGCPAALFLPWRSVNPQKSLAVKHKIGVESRVGKWLRSRKIPAAALRRNIPASFFKTTPHDQVEKRPKNGMVVFGKGFPGSR
jgi:hypothetical protein